MSLCSKQEHEWNKRTNTYNSEKQCIEFIGNVPKCLTTQHPATYELSFQAYINVDPTQQWVFQHKIIAPITTVYLPAYIEQRKPTTGTRKPPKQSTTTTTTQPPAQKTQENISTNTSTQQNLTTDDEIA